MIEDLARLLRQMGINFSAEGNRIQWAQPHSNNAGSVFKTFRCLPHIIINLSMKAALKAFSTSSAFEWDNEDFSDDNDNDNNENNGWLDMSYIKDDNDEEYIETLKTDVTTATHHLVTTCRASGQCHEGFCQTIKEGNKNGTFGEKVYAWSHSSMIWTLGGPPHISWLTVFLSCMLQVFREYNIYR